MEESQETVGVGSLVGVLGFPWEGDSNEGGKTFLLQKSKKRNKKLFYLKTLQLDMPGLFAFILEYLQNSKVFLPKGVGKDPLFSVCPLRIFKT